ncbi:CXXC motif containing zinc binding protein isoform X3 [Zonotrichia leucophrys gambelii]|uniref:CXXC motif containing zinc binding protein n=1 Tax=Junco hyemalis TaxID=40217 RepID=A0A8C5J5C4_JUNHY
MGRIGLQLRATLENITRLRAEGEDFRWYLKLKCGNCGEVSEKWQYLRLMDSAPLKGGRGSATMVQKCKLCSRENSIDILSQTIKPYNAEDSEKFKTIVEFECRGLEPVDFQPQLEQTKLEDHGQFQAVQSTPQGSELKDSSGPVCNDSSLVHGHALCHLTPCYF